MWQMELDYPSHHQSLKMINDKQFEKDAFNFKSTDQETVSKVIDNLNPRKKVIGADKISVKLLKLTKNIIVEPITNLINHSIKTCTFLNGVKRAQISPLFNTDDAMTIKLQASQSPSNHI